MSSSSPWDAYSQHTGFPPSLESYPHPFSSDIRCLTSNSAAGMSSLPGENMLGYHKPSDLAAVNLNLPSSYASYGQPYPAVPELGYSGSSLRPNSTAHSPGSAPDLPVSSPHGQYSSTPNSDNQSSSPSFPNSTSLYTPSTISSSISSSPYAQTFGSSSSSADASSRGPFSPFAQSYGYPMYGYNQVGGFPSSNSLDGVNRYMGGISSSSLMQPPTMGLYSNNQTSQMPFPYHPSMAWGATIPGFPFKESSDLMSQEELDRYRYRQLSNPYFPALPPGGSPVRNFPPHSLQPSMIRTPPFMDERSQSSAPKKPKKSTEEAERPPTPAPKDPDSFHSHRGIYLFTSNVEPGSPNFYSDRYIMYEKDLCEKLSRVSLPGKIQYVYNPLEYAFDSHLKFVRRFCTGEKYILFVGMNPGPFGMSQNGVPFGECAIVKEWLQIDGEVLKPVLEHPKRRVVGLECSRSDVTGGRFWQLFRTLCHTPEHFFRTSYVHKLCPFAFLTDTGKNVTPPQLTSSVLDQINILCNATLVEVVRLLKSKYVVCIGKYALQQAQKALSADEFTGITLECLMHPSPINPAANKGWADIATKQLTEIGIADIIRRGRIPYHPPSSSQPTPPMNQHSQSHLPFSTKQSPAHYDFQPQQIQPYDHSKPTQGSNSHQSPVHAPPPTQSPTNAPSRSLSSPARASSRSQSSPVHSSSSQSSIQQQNAISQSPSTAASGNCSVLQTGDHSQDNLQLKIETPCKDEVNSLDPPIIEAYTANPDAIHERNRLNANATPSSGSPEGNEDDVQHSDSESGSDVSKGNSPNMLYTPGNPPTDVSDSQMSSQHSLMTVSSAHISMHGGTASQQMHHPLGSSHPHLDMRAPISASPGIQRGRSLDQPMNDQAGSLDMKTPNSHVGLHNPHIGSMNSHLGSSVGSHGQVDAQAGMGTHGMGMHRQMACKMNPYDQVDMDHQMTGYGPSMPLNNYPGSPGMRSNLEMASYSYPMGLHNSHMGMAAMSGMHGNRHMGPQLGMFNYHMGSMMAGPEHLSMHPGMNAAYDNQIGKEMPYSSHYFDKPPECT